MSEHLREDKFIHEGYKKDPWPLWIFLGVVIAVTLSLVAFRLWQEEALDELYKDTPFLQVTNREISLFLWQHPEFMRTHQNTKSSYLPGFHSTGLSTIKPGKGGVFAVAPPEVFHRYHLWHLLLGEQRFLRKVEREEFEEFIQANPVWRDEQSIDLDGLETPLLQAFVGWKNYTKEGDAINALKITYGDVRTFMLKYPKYAPNYWRNYYPNYLEGYDTARADVVVPDEALPGFLRVAIYNSQNRGR